MYYMIREVQARMCHAQVSEFCIIMEDMPVVSPQHSLPPLQEKEDPPSEMGGRC